MEKTDRAGFVSWAVRLAWLTIAYNTVEGVVSIYYGATDMSMALAGFGVDSFIEVGSAILVLWRLRHETMSREGVSINAERKATLGIGILFIVLAVITSVGGIYQIVTEGRPDTTLPGFIISTLSLAFMFWLYREKTDVAIRIDSATVMKDARCSLACLKLSAILFAGSIVYLLVPSLWMADSVAAVLLSILIGKEGVETVKNSQSENFSGGCGCEKKSVTIL